MRPAIAIILLLYGLLWAGVALRSVQRRSARGVWLCITYHLLAGGALFMMLPFYWMIATSLKDFQGANQTPPTWLPVGTEYFAPAPGGDGEIAVGLLGYSNMPWREIRELELLEVAPIDRVGEADARFMVAGSDLQRVRRPRWENYVEAWNAPAQGNPENPITFTRYFQVSIITSVLTTLGTLLTSVLAAYAFAKLRFRGRSLFFFFVLATIMVPGQVLLIPNFLILAQLPDFTFGLRWLDNYPSLIVPWLASVFSIFLLRQFFMGVPDELWDAAQIDGAGHLRYLWTVVLPLSRPVLITAGLFIFLGGWNSLLWPLIVTTRPEMRTLMVGLQAFNQEMQGNFHLLMAASTIAIMPVVVIFFFLQRFFVEGIARSGIK